MLPSLIRIQPVAPDQPSWPQLFGDVVAAFALLPISGLFLMLGMVPRTSCGRPFRSLATGSRCG